MARGYVDLIAEGSLGRLTPAAAQALGLVADRLAEMDDLIGDLSEVTRLEMGAGRLRDDPLDLVVLARRAADKMRPHLAAGQRLLLELPKRRVEATGDGFRIGRVISNLIDNAVKYSPEGGEIRCTVGSSPGLSWVRVSDDGVGISGEGMGRLFQPFSRLERTAELGQPGMGLGLYLCRQIARAHGGDLAAAAGAGRGAVFTLTLPA